MTVELRPMGVSCNLQCTYCYQNPQREAGNVSRARNYDLEKMKDAVRKENKSFTLFGGEPLLLPMEDLEELFSWGFVKFGKNSIQTNGTLIQEKHIEIFEKYNVNVGISCDGPGNLSDSRWAGTIEKTRAATYKTEEIIRKLKARNIAVSVIITLHKHNAIGKNLKRLQEWVSELDSIGVKSARLHVLEVDSKEIQSGLALTQYEVQSAMVSFAKQEPKLKSLKLDVFGDIKKMLVGDDKHTTCVWNACDPYTTRAVRGVEGQGQASNCGRTNKEGIDFLKSSQEGFERYISLYNTPQNAGGCKGCRFFLMCKGQCPGTALEGDWRNRTEYCDLWMHIFSIEEAKYLNQGKIPLSLSPIRPLLEGAFLKAWTNGRNPNFRDLFKSIKLQDQT